MASASFSNYKVFISHAGEDKTTIAFPLRDMLLSHGITAFVDERDMPGGTWSEEAMTTAMETADIAVVVLSPEFVARKWPMKELLCFLRRCEKPLADGKRLPVIIPLFYRLSIKQLYDEPRFDRIGSDGKSLYQESRFSERIQNGEPEAQVANIKAALRKVRSAMGIENYVQASNESTTAMLKCRNVLLTDLYEQVKQASSRVSRMITPDTTDTTAAVSPGEQFCASYYEEADVSDLVLKFEEADENGNASTIEAAVLRAVQARSESTNVVSIQGIGGVGKTSILRGLSSRDEVNKRFRHGTYLISLGADANRNRLIESLCRTIEDSDGAKKAEEMQKQKMWKDVFKSFRSWFAERECLFMVDDVWETAEISSEVIKELKQLHLGGLNSKVVITTRSTEIASQEVKKHFILEPREPEEAQCRAILMLHSDTEVDQSRTEDKRAIIEVLRKCGGLPLFLKLAGRAIKSLSFKHGKNGSIAYRLYSRTLATSIPGMLKVKVDSYDRLASSLSVSLRLLEDRKDRWGFPVRLSVAEIYRRLCVLLKHSRVPMTMLMYLWELRSKAEATIVAREFEQMALATVYVEKMDSEYVERLGMHDSLHEYALSETQEHGEETLGHRIVLEGYGKCLERETDCRAWWSTRLEIDGYVHNHVCHHLRWSGFKDELTGLLLKPEWTIRLFEVCGIRDLELSYSLGITILDTADDHERDGPVVQDETKTIGDTRDALTIVCKATRLSSGYNIHHPRELCFQLYGRLKFYAEANPVIKEYVNRLAVKANLLWGPWLRCISSPLTSPGGALRRMHYIGLQITSMIVSDDGAVVYCGCGNGTIAFVDLKGGDVSRHKSSWPGEVSCLALSRDGKLLYSGFTSGAVEVLDTEMKTLLRSWSHEGSVLAIGHGLAVMRDTYLMCMQVRDLETGEVLLDPFNPFSQSGQPRMDPLHLHIVKDPCLIILRDGEHFVSAGLDNHIRIGSAKCWTQVGDDFGGHKSSISCVSVTPDERYMMSGSSDCTIRIWDVAKRAQIGELFSPSGAIVCGAGSRDGRRFAFGSRNDDIVRIWDFTSGKEDCTTLEGHGSKVTGVLFHPVDNSVISCSWDGTVRVWDVSKASRKEHLDRHDAKVKCVTFTSSGMYLVSGSADNSIRVWDAKSGMQIGKPLMAHSSTVNDIAVTSDDQQILSVSSDKTVRVWDLESHALLHTLTGHNGTIDRIALTPCGDRAVTSSTDKTVRVWDLKLREEGHLVLGKYAVNKSSVGRGSSGNRLEVETLCVSDDGSTAVSIFSWTFWTEMSDYLEIDWETYYGMTKWNLESRERILNEQLTKEYGNGVFLYWPKIVELAGGSSLETKKASISLDEYDIWYICEEEKKLLGVLEGSACCLALSPDNRTICAGLTDGRVVFMTLEGLDTVMSA